MYSGCSRLMMSIVASHPLKQPLRPVSARLHRPALLPHQIPQRIRQMRSAAVSLFVDQVAVFLVRNLLEILDQLFTTRVDEQLNLPRRRPQFPVHQVHAVAHMRIRLRYPKLNRRAAVRPEEIPHDLVVGVPRGLRAVSGGIAVYDDSPRVFPEYLDKAVA